VKLHVKPPTEEERERAVKMLLGQGRTREEALCAISRWADGVPMDTESATCWTCEGFRFSRLFERCFTCHGTGKALRMKLPQEVADGSGT